GGAIVCSTLVSRVVVDRAFITAAGVIAAHVIGAHVVSTRACAAHAVVDATHATRARIGHVHGTAGSAATADASFIRVGAGRSTSGGSAGARRWIGGAGCRAARVPGGTVGI